MTFPRSGQSQAIKCGGLELEIVNSPLGLRGVGGSEEDQGERVGWLWEVVVIGCIKLFMTVQQISPKLSVKQHTFTIVSRIRNLGTAQLGSLAQSLPRGCSQGVSQGCGLI